MKSQNYYRSLPPDQAQKEHEEELRKNDRNAFWSMLIISLAAFVLSALLSCPAYPRQEMDWQDIAVAQEILGMQGYRGLVVIGGVIDNDREPIELHIQATPLKGKGLVVGIILKVEGGNLLQEVQE